MRNRQTTRNACCRKGDGAEFQISHVTRSMISPRDCETACDQRAGCNAFSYSKKWRDCFLCKKCSQTPDRHRTSKLYQTWLKQTKGAASTDLGSANASFAAVGPVATRALWIQLNSSVDVLLAKSQAFAANATRGNSLCIAGLIHPGSFKVACCDPGCGICGGRYCQYQTGGRRLCCPSAIYTRGCACKSPSDVGCTADNSAVGTAFCQGGTLGVQGMSRVCCSQSCKTCGHGAPCGDLPGNGTKRKKGCCLPHILKTGRVCKTKDDTACVVPDIPALEAPDTPLWLAAPNTTDPSERCRVTSSIIVAKEAAATQARIDPNSTAKWHPMLCSKGLLVEQTATTPALCCAKQCANCGPASCFNSSLGASNPCCPEQIVRLGVNCKHADDTVCVLPDQMTQGPLCAYGIAAMRGAHATRLFGPAAICCSRNCGTCGGMGCAGRPGGPINCCTARARPACRTPSDRGCRLPTDDVRNLRRFFGSKFSSMPRRWRSKADMQFPPFPAKSKPSKSSFQLVPAGSAAALKSCTQCCHPAGMPGWNGSVHVCCPSACGRCDDAMCGRRASNTTRAKCCPAVIRQSDRLCTDRSSTACVITEQIAPPAAPPHKAGSAPAAQIVSSLQPITQPIAVRGNLYGDALPKLTQGPANQWMLAAGMPTVRLLLKYCNLERYTSEFERLGFDDLSTLISLQARGELEGIATRSIGMKLGHFYRVRLALSSPPPFLFWSPQAALTLLNQQTLQGWTNTTAQPAVGLSLPTNPQLNTALHAVLASSPLTSATAAKLIAPGTSSSNLAVAGNAAARSTPTVVPGGSLSPSVPVQVPDSISAAGGARPIPLRPAASGGSGHLAFTIKKTALCLTGKRDGNICCAKQCGKFCNRPGCERNRQRRKGLGDDCCGPRIVQSNKRCIEADDMGCFISASAAPPPPVGRALQETTLGDEERATYKALQDKALDDKEAASLRAKARWDEVCGVEKARAARHLESKLGFPSTALDRPLNQTRPKDFSSMLARLAALLESRGQLCSADAPCSVQSTHAAGNKGGFQICMEALPESERTPLMCETIRANSETFLKKACLRGKSRRCFQFGGEAIEMWASSLKVSAEMVQPDVPLASMGKCAVVLSGHTLRCGTAWGKHIDSNYYDTVLCANWLDVDKAAKTMFASKVGSRMTHGFEQTRDQCNRIGDEHKNTSCIDGELRRQITYNFMKLRRLTGLGLGRSGGSVIGIALSLCASVDVYGAGMFADGPSSDVLYGHWYEDHFPESCQNLQCMRGTTGIAQRKEAVYLTRVGSNAASGSRLCTPSQMCTGQAPPDAKGMSRASETPTDFFFLSDLRLYILQ